MVQFGQQLLALAYAPWKDHYLNYHRLKRMLQRDLVDADSGSSAGSCNSSIGSNNSNHSSLSAFYNNNNSNNNKNQQQRVRQHHDYEHDEDGDELDDELENEYDEYEDLEQRDNAEGSGGQFVPLLHREIVQCVLFFLQQQGELAAQLRQVYQPQQRQLAFRIWEWHDCYYVPPPPNEDGDDENHGANNNEYNNNDMDDDDDLENDEEQQLRQRRRLELWTQLQQLTVALRTTVGLELYQLVRFAELTLTAVRKILKKHDKLVQQRRNRNRHYNNHPSSAALMSQYFAPHHHHPLHSSYWNSSNTNTNNSGTANAAGAVESHLHQLQHLEGVEVLVITLKQSFAELQRLEHILWTGRVRESSMAASSVPWSSRPSSLSRPSLASSHQHQQSPQSQPNISTSSSGTRRGLPRRIPSAPDVTIFTTTTTNDDSDVAPSNMASSCPSPPPPPPSINRSVPSRATTTASEHCHHPKQHPTQTQQQEPPLTSIFFVTEPILLKIEAARQRLQETSQLVQLLAAPALMLERTAELVVDDDDHDDGDENIRSPTAPPLPLLVLFNDPSQQSLHSFETQPPPHHERWRATALNLGSTFLWWTNYYIVTPTAGSYAIRLMGGASTTTTSISASSSSATQAGLVLALTPLAACVSTLWMLLYSSKRTTTTTVQSSYRTAFLWASGWAVVGNLLYALAGPCQCRTLLWLGRIGLGWGNLGTSTLNRQHLSAHAAVRGERPTTAAAYWVVAGSLGRVTGPALAALLGTMTRRRRGEIDSWWSVENAPGWIMVGAWIVYFVLVSLYFRDPPSRRRNARRNNSSSNNNTTTTTKGRSEGSTFTVVAATTTGETTPLLTVESANGDDFAAQVLTDNNSNRNHHNNNNNNNNHIMWNNVPVMTTLLLVFVLKMTLECCWSSAATLTHYFFEWETCRTGTFLAILALLLVWPAPAFLVGMIGRCHLEDRHVIFATLLGMIVGVWGIRQYNNDASSLEVEEVSSSYSVSHYVMFTVILVVATHALESPSLSLLRQSVAPHWAGSGNGVWNLGLMVTEVEHLGRTAGNLLLAGCGNTLDDGLLLNRIFGALGWIVTVTWISVCVTFSQLEPPLDLED